MAAILSSHAASSLERKAGAPAAETAKHAAASAFFKYYIHDSVTTLRFELIGDLRAAHVVELAGSWETARTTLSQRRLVVDTARVESADEQGREWLHSMRTSGADVTPTAILDGCGATASANEAVQLSRWSKKLGWFRGR